jgi:isocitrate dehydrogenase kinase/phosphatase
LDRQQRFARVILNGFYAYFAEFENITLAARTRFEQAQWPRMAEVSSRRIDIYKETVMETLSVARQIAGEQINDLGFWSATRSIYASLVQGKTNFEIAETFYNSIFNSHFGHRGIRNEYAFVFSPQGDVPPVDIGRVVNRYPVAGDPAGAFSRLLDDYAFNIPFEDRERDVASICAAIERHMTAHFDCGTR